MSKDELSKAKKVRQALHMNAEKEFKKAQNFTKDTPVPLSKLRVSLAKLKDYLSDLKKENEKILGLTGEAETDAEVETAADLADKLLESVFAVEVYLTPLDKSNSRLSDVSAKSSPAKQTVKLPKLDIEKFSGDPLKWQEFWDSFTSTIDSNDNLSDIDKFKYLKTYLTGDALRVSDGYMLTSVHYKQVIDELKKRFGNEQIAIFSHISAMLNLPVSDHTVGSLQHTLDSCEKHVRSLLALGLQESHFEQVFIPIILSKLPKYVKSELYRENGTKPWSLAQLRELLRNEIRAREMSELSFDKKAGGSKNGSASAGKSSGSILFGTEKTVKCRFCQEGHYSDSCTKFATVEARKRQITGSCFSCLRDGHSAKACRNRRKCYYCQRTGHHRSLCEQRELDRGKTTGSGPPTAGSASALNAGAADFVPGGSQLLSAGQYALLQTALADVQDSSGSRKQRSRLLFDTACSRTCVTEAKMKQLGLMPIGEELVSIAGFQDRKRKTCKYKVVEFTVLLSDGSRRKITANVVPVISCPIQKFPISSAKYPVLLHVPLAEPLPTQPVFVEIDILVGSDYYYEFMTQDWITCADGLVLQGSRLGYIPSGRISANSTDDKLSSSVLLITRSPVEITEIHSAASKLERFLSLEEVALKDEKVMGEDQEAMLNFEKTVSSRSGRYEVGLPWRAQNSELKDHYALSLGCLKSQVARLRSQNSTVIAKYDNTIKEQLQLGIVEPAPEKPDGTIVHYLPHHCVIRPDKETTKLRVVYNASAKMSKTDPSLNDCLYRGPVLLENLCGMILRFRLAKVAIASDIEKAFLQVGIRPDDRDAARFLWLKDISGPVCASNIAVYRFTRVFFGAVSSPFLLAATILHHLSKQDTETAKEILNNVYVDNVLAGRPDSRSASDFYYEAKSLFSTASMNLREWYTNDQVFRQSIPELDRGTQKITKVLGITWDTDADVLSCTYSGKKLQPRGTKREVLRRIASVYDPCGWIAPVTLPGKLLVQQLWKDEVDWDVAVSENHQKQINQLDEQLALISDIKLPRFQCDSKGLQGATLHAFCDASGNAYGGVVYLVAGGETHLLFSKGRLCPSQKKLSIPRLELMACLVASRLLAFVELELRVVSDLPKVVWSDSQCSLAWIKNQNSSTVFVRNRVEQISKYSEIQFRYVPTTMNPADLLSRGCTVATLQDSSLWWHGPDWLPTPGSWPVWSPATKMDTTIDFASAVVTILIPSGPSHLEIDYSRFSKFSKLIRAVAWVLRFTAKLKHTAATLPDTLQSSEVLKAKEVICRAAQSDGFSGFQSNGKFQDLIKVLGLFVDSSGLIRCRGRYALSDMSEEAKCPILLPKNHPVTTLIIQASHARSMHGGTIQTLAEVRKEFWPIHGRSQVKQVIKACRVCRRVEGGPYLYPQAPPLPADRSQRAMPFSIVGVDHLGPLLIRLNGEELKVWIMLFTCAVTRAIHLEVAENLSTDQVLMCLKRFTAKYREPKVIISDNATNFRAADKILQKMSRLLRSSEIQDFAATRGIEWKFITENAPWMGGFYERLVGVVKRALRKNLLRKKVTLMELQTVVCEVCACVNSRPLTTADEPCDLVLTPAHFLNGGPSIGPLSHDFQSPKDPDYDDASDGRSLITQWRRIQAIQNEFWEIWRNEYLASLREQNANLRQRNTSAIFPSLNSVVLVKDANLPRGIWRLGRVVKMFESRDGACRSVSVELANGSVIKRPTNLLFPLEMGAGGSEKSDQADKTTIISPSSQAKTLTASLLDKRTADAPVSSIKAKRAAAVKALSAIRELASESSDSE